MKRKRLDSQTPPASSIAPAGTEPVLPINRIMVAGLGASAGGLEALEGFFNQMPSDSGIAFIVVQHLSPDHESALVDLLSRCTDMPVEQAHDNTKVAPDRVYVIPPNATLTIKDRTLYVTPPTEARGRRTPIDSLFCSLAEDCGEDAVCIMLSGTGTDGTRGLKAVKEHGGMAMAQNLESARYDAMLRSAIATGLVDHVLAVADMPAKLMEYAEHVGASSGKSDDLRQQIAKCSARIHGVLRRRVGHDFSQYKVGTISRRLERRMKALQINSVESYLKILEGQSEEADLLFKDLLIGVTEFFRDPEAFEVLANEVIPKLFERNDGASQIRVCIVGCATGEEAYSIGILLCEHAASLEEPPAIKIFATDIDERSLEIARKGYYPAGIAEHVSVERLARFFVKQDGAYQVKRELRDLCLFSSHSFIKDPPFSRLDLISCRNVMIYLSETLQRKVVPLFHYALRSEGYLFLGPSETVNAHRDLFRSIDKKHRIFQKKDTSPRTAIAFPLSEIPRAKPVAGGQPQSTEQPLSKRLERIILNRYAPACVIVNEIGTAVYYSGGVSRYLEQPTGSPDNNVVNMACEGLRIPLRAALHRAATARERATQRDIIVQTLAGEERIDLLVEVLSEGKDTTLFMVVITDSVSDRVRQTAETLAVDASSEEIIRHLENQLESAREHAQAMFEELESSNEELSSANEEFQSTNEELETSKEELQSFNEELETVNSELNRRVSELDSANSDLQNLLNGTQIATIFLDTALRIRNFTPTAGRMFHLIAGDVGRPITDLASQFTDEDLIRDAKEVLATLSQRERQVTGRNDRHYQQRILPYRTVNNVIDGIVLVFVDVTDLRRAEQVAQQARLYAESIVDTVREPLLVLNAAMQVISASKAFFERFQVLAEDTIGNSLFELGNRQWDVPLLRRLLSDALPQKQRVDDYEVHHDFLRLGTRTMLLNGRRLEQGASETPLFLLAIEDITDRKKAEENLRQSEEQLRSLFEQTNSGIAQTDLNGRFLMVNEGFCRMVGRSGAELLSVRMQDITLPEDLPNHEEKFLALTEGHTPGFVTEKRYLRPDGSSVWAHVQVSAIHGAEGEIRYLAATVTDISERKRSEEVRGMLVALVESSDDAIISQDLNGIIRTWNAGAERLFGYTAQEIVGQPVAKLIPADRADEGLRILELVRGGKRVEHFDTVRCRKDGTLVDISLTVSPIFNERGEVIAASKIAWDITDRKRIEQERRNIEERERAMAVTTAVQEMEAELARVSRAFTVGEMATSIAHEVNQPLAGIVTNAEACLRWLKAKTPNVAEAQESLSLIVRDGNRASDVIRRIREFLKNDGPQSIQLQVNDVIQETIALAHSELLKNQIVVHLELSPDLPMVWADRIQLQQVILNLIINASEAMATVTKIPLQLTVSSQRLETDSVLVAVKDRGNGIDPQKLVRMFEAFFTTKPSGMGMGLSISRSIIEAHGGRIWATPNEDSGITVQFTVPGDGDDQ